MYEEQHLKVGRDSVLEGRRQVRVKEREDMQVAFREQGGGRCLFFPYSVEDVKESMENLEKMEY